MLKDSTVSNNLFRQSFVLSSIFSIDLTLEGNVIVPEATLDGSLLENTSFIHILVCPASLKPIILSEVNKGP